MDTQSVKAIEYGLNFYLLIASAIIPVISAIVTFKIVEYRVNSLAEDLKIFKTTSRVDLNKISEAMSVSVKDYKSHLQSEIDQHRQEVRDNTRAIWDKIDKLDSKFDKAFSILGRIEGVLSVKDNKQ